MITQNNICTKENPYREGAEGKWIHPEAQLVYAEYDSLANGGSYDRYECPNCGVSFWVQLPD